MIESILPLVESRMREGIAPAQAGDHPVARAVLHHLAAGGSRVRAILCLNVSFKLGLEVQDATTLATICELLHNASLIQDDLIDRAPSRRGRQSVWVAFDDATAVCAGDLLLASAFALVGELGCVRSLTSVLSLVHRRTQDVILGQGAEQSLIARDLACYESVAMGKSASLLSLPLELPLLLSGHEQSLATAQRACGAFAAAYQMLDDLVDYREDVRNGSLNAVSVALIMGCADYSSACTLVCNRAEELTQRTIEDAALLPMDCGASMIAYAEKMREALIVHRNSALQSVEQLQHGG